LFALLQQFFDAGRNAWILFEVDEMPSGIAANLLGALMASQLVARTQPSTPLRRSVDARVTPALEIRIALGIE
jgi:hypothetical protein